VDVAGPGGDRVLVPVCGADHREPAVVTLRAGAEYAPVAPFPGARLHPLRLKIDRLQAEAARVARNPVGDWECALARIGREINLAERKLNYATR
jgi:hypothetical protein